MPLLHSRVSQTAGRISAEVPRTDRPTDRRARRKIKLYVSP